MASVKPLIGWREWVALPGLAVDHVKAKIDTGARTSALHAWDVTVAGDHVRFTVHPFQGDDETVVCSQAPLITHREVRSSNGLVEVRPVIEAEVVMGEQRVAVELTLATRDDMGFRMLLGRQALRRLGFAVDPGRSFRLGGTRFSPP